VQQQPLVDAHPRQNHGVAIAVEALAKAPKVGTELTDRRLQAVDPIAELFAHRPALPPHHEEEDRTLFRIRILDDDGVHPRDNQAGLRGLFASNSTSFLNFF
jgi:hypothetical protein